MMLLAKWSLLPVRLSLPKRDRTWNAFRLTNGLCLCVLLWCCGCASTAKKPAFNSTSIPAEVAADFQQSIQAWNAGDLAGFIQIYADSATFTMTNELLVGKQAIRRFYAPLFAPNANREALSFDQFDVEVLAPDIALVRGVYRSMANEKEQRRGLSTLVFRRIAGQWRIIHDHTT